jgi:hypothetical protein
MDKQKGLVDGYCKNEMFENDYFLYEGIYRAIRVVGILF